MSASAALALVRSSCPMIVKCKDLVAISNLQLTTDVIISCGKNEQPRVLMCGTAKVDP
jgi:hypothetical protein